MGETNKIVLTDINLPFASLFKLTLQMIGVQIVIAFIFIIPIAIIFFVLA